MEEYLIPFSGNTTEQIPQKYYQIMYRKILNKIKTSDKKQRLQRSLLNCKWWLAPGWESKDACT